MVAKLEVVVVFPLVPIHSTLKSLEVKGVEALVVEEEQMVQVHPSQLHTNFEIPSNPYPPLD